MVADWRIILTSDKTRNYLRNQTKLTLDFMHKNNIYGDKIKYPAGTMFIARANIFEHIKKLNLSEINFNKFESASSNQFPHIMETLIGTIVISYGLKIEDVYHTQSEKRRHRQKNILYILKYKLSQKIARLFFQSGISKKRGTFQIKIFKIPIYRKKIVQQ